MARFAMFLRTSRTARTVRSRTTEVSLRNSSGPGLSSYLKRNADVKATGANHRGCAMLAEIFMIRLESVARAAKEAANSPRFVPVTLPAAKAS
jgi:hypothetical protein